MARGLLKSEGIDKDRETREGWPLLTVETELNGDSKRTNERDPFLVCSLGLPFVGTRYFCSALVAALVGPVQNTTYINYFVPFARQAGQAAVLGRLSLSVCLLNRTRTNISEQNFSSTNIFITDFYYGERYDV
jgi:hypothetical protein